MVAVEKALELYGAPVYVRKQIVHNKHVVATLERRGAIFVDETDEVPEGSIVVFSAHGVAPAVHEEAASARQLRTIDATCPLVTKVHKEAVRFAAERLRHPADRPRGPRGGRGHRGRGARPTSRWSTARTTSTRVTVRDPAQVVWLSQTTLSVDETMETVRRLRERFPQLQDPPSDDICYATQNRQVAVKKIAAESDLVIVVGSSNSSNSVRLVEVALEHGAGAAHRVDDATEIDEAWLDGVAHRRRDLGASVPEILVQDVLGWLADRGYGPAEEVVSAEEDLMFSLPQGAAPRHQGRPGGAALRPSRSSRGRRRARRTCPRPHVTQQLTRGQQPRRGLDRGDRLELAVDEVEVAHPAGRDEHAPLEGADEQVVVLHGALQAAPELARTCAERAEPGVQLPAEREQLLGAAGERLRLPGQRDRPQQRQQASSGVARTTRSAMACSSRAGSAEQAAARNASPGTKQTTSSGEGSKAVQYSLAARTSTCERRARACAAAARCCRSSSADPSLASRKAASGAFASTTTCLPPGRCTTRSGRTPTPSGVVADACGGEVDPGEHAGVLDDPTQLDLAPGAAGGGGAQRAGQRRRLRAQRLAGGADGLDLLAEPGVLLQPVALERAHLVLHALPGRPRAARAWRRAHGPGRRRTRGR